MKKFKEFCILTNRSMPDLSEMVWKENHPILNITYCDALAYANYYEMNLMTDKEWMWAAKVKIFSMREVTK